MSTFAAFKFTKLNKDIRLQPRGVSDNDPKAAFLCEPEQREVQSFIFLEYGKQNQSAGGQLRALAVNG